MKAKPNVKATIRINAYEVVSRAIEDGIEYGYNRAHKHTTTPSPEALKTAIYEAITNSLCEVLIFDNDDK